MLLSHAIDHSDLSRHDVNDAPPIRSEIKLVPIHDVSLRLVPYRFNLSKGSNYMTRTICAHSPAGVTEACHCGSAWRCEMYPEAARQMRGEADTVREPSPPTEKGGGMSYSTGIDIHHFAGANTWTVRVETTEAGPEGYRIGKANGDANTQAEALAITPGLVEQAVQAMRSRGWTRRR